MNWNAPLLKLFSEEEMKRLNEASLQANSYGAVAFSYNPETQDVPPDGSGEKGAVKGMYRS